MVLHQIIMMTVWNVSHLVPDKTYRKDHAQLRLGTDAVSSLRCSATFRLRQCATVNLEVKTPVIPSEKYLWCPPQAKLNRFFAVSSTVFISFSSPCSNTVVCPG